MRYRPAALAAPHHSRPALTIPFRCRARTIRFRPGLALGLALVLACCLVPTGAPIAAAPVASEQDSLAQLFEKPMGTLGAVALEGERAYLGVGQRLQVLDLSNPAAPRELGFSPPLGASVQAIAPDPRAAGRVLVSAGNAGLWIFDSSGSAKPRALAHLPGLARGLQVDGKRAYVQDDGLRILDIAAADAPREIGRVELPFEAFHVAGDIAWLAAGVTGVLAYDLSDPMRPAPVGSLVTPGVAHDIRVSGQHAFVADGGARLSVLEVSDPSLPRLVGELLVDLSDVQECWQSSCGLDANTIRIAGSRGLLGLRRGASAFGSRSPAQLVTLDLSEPAAPRQLDKVARYGNPVSIAIADDRILVAERPLWWYNGTGPCSLSGGGLTVFDADLQSLAGYAPPAGAAAIAMYGGLTHLADNTTGLRTYNRAIKQVQVNGWRYGSIYGSSQSRDLVAGPLGVRIAIGGQTTGFLALLTEGLPERLEHPLNGCAPPDRKSWFRRITTDGRWDYLLDEAGGLQLFEPGAYRSLARLADLSASDLAARDGRVYLAEPGGLVIVGVTDEPGLSLLGMLSLEGYAAGIDVASGAKQVVLAGERGLALVDIQDPSAPELLATMPTQGSARAVDLDNGLAYAATDAGVQVFDVLAPGHPVEIARADGMHHAGAIAVDTERVAVLATGGLFVFAAPDAAGLPRPQACPGLAARRDIPAGLIEQALASPERIGGWGLLDRPQLPESPFNTRRHWLTVRQASQRFHPLFNSLIYEASCTNDG